MKVQLFVPRVAIENTTKVENIVLMGTVAQNFRDIIRLQNVDEPLLCAKQILDLRS